VRFSYSLLDVKSSTAQISSAYPTVDATPPEHWCFLPSLGRIPSFPKASTFVFLLLCELLYFEFSHTYENVVLPELLGTLKSPKSSSTSALLAATTLCLKELILLSLFLLNP